MLALAEQMYEQLPDFISELRKIDEIKSAHGKAINDLKDTNSALDLAKKALADTKSGLTAQQLKNIRDYEENVFEKRKELESLLTQIDAGKAQHAEIQVNIANAQQMHSQIQASIESLRRKHFG